MIYVYHNISKIYTDNPNSVSVRTFCNHMAQIKRNKYKVVKITEYNPDAHDQIVLRFDDGYADIMNALPILRKYKFPFHVYIVGDWFGTDGFIGPNDVATIKTAGGTLEWHTNSHVDLTLCSDARLLHELTIPDKIKSLDKDGFNSIAYPFWKTDERVLRMVKTRFKYGCAGNLGGGNVCRLNPYSLDGIKIKEDTMISDKIVKYLEIAIPTRPCNFRCHYCYVGQHYADAQRGTVEKFKYTPDDFATALSTKRLGGRALCNFCADGETLILPFVFDYIKAFLDAGHFVMIVTNMSQTAALEKLILLPDEYKSRLFLKCSFHWLELKRLGLLDVFADNVNKCWAAGISVTVEITPNDELVSEIPEIKKYSMAHFGALPHITVARDELNDFTRLTKYTVDEYNKIWGEFDSDLFRFKSKIWGIKRNEFCYAGDWFCSINLATGDICHCSSYKTFGNIFNAQNRPLPTHAICHNCPFQHCYNGHAWLAFGAVPEIETPTYSELRDRTRLDGTHWLYPRIKDVFSQRLYNNNQEYGKLKKIWLDIKNK